MIMGQLLMKWAIWFWNLLGVETPGEADKQIATLLFAVILIIIGCMGLFVADYFLEKWAHNRMTEKIQKRKERGYDPIE